MVMLAILTSAFLSPIAGENLLANPSLEDRTPDGRPRSWSSFVQPQPGAFADFDPLSFGGESSILLHNPEPYAEEPANNWSQVIVADVRGKQMEFSGYVRTEAAHEAALWIQCFQQRPTRIVAGQTSSTNNFIAGDNEWTRVSVEVSAPQTTDFVVVRCVLKGQGTAWFDELRLDVTGQVLPEFEPLEPPADIVADSAPSAQPDTQPDALDILQVSRALQQAVADLESTNARIMERVQALQEDLARSRAEAAALQAAPKYGPHPLVPHGYVPEDDPK